MFIDGKDYGISRSVKAMAPFDRSELVMGSRPQKTKNIGSWYDPSSWGSYLESGYASLADTTSTIKEMYQSEGFNPFTDYSTDDLVLPEVQPVVQTIDASVDEESALIAARSKAVSNVSSNAVATSSFNLNNIFIKYKMPLMIGAGVLAFLIIKQLINKNKKLEFSGMRNPYPGSSQSFRGHRRTLRSARNPQTWSGGVEVKHHAPEGLFLKSPYEIAQYYVMNYNDLGKAISSINFYENRAGSSLDEERQDALSSAKRILQTVMKSA